MKHLDNWCIRELCLRLIIIFCVWTLKKKPSVPLHWVLNWLFYKAIQHVVHMKACGLLKFLIIFHSNYWLMEYFWLWIEFQMFHWEEHDICPRCASSFSGSLPAIRYNHGKSLPYYQQLIGQKFKWNIACTKP